LLVAERGEGISDRVVQAADLVAAAVELGSKVADRFLNPLRVLPHSRHPEVELVLRRLRSDPPIDILVNNAGAALIGDFATADPVKMDDLLRLNVVAPTLLASAVVGRMVERGNGAIINIASVLALLPEYSRGIYSATKSYLMTLSQGLAAEVASKGVYVQAVLPAATRTEIYERAGGDASKVPNVM
jgi:short-subunit dehydrogenase